MNEDLTNLYITLLQTKYIRVLLWKQNYKLHINLIPIQNLS